MLKIFSGSLEDIEGGVNRFARKHNFEIVNVVDSGSKSDYIFFVIFKKKVTEDDE